MCEWRDVAGHLIVCASAVAAMSLFVTGCDLEAPGGCTSQADCRGDRVCAPSGRCLPPGATRGDTSPPPADTAGPDLGPEEDVDDGPPNFEVATVLLRERCGPSDERIIEFEFVLTESVSCGGGGDSVYALVTFTNPGWDDAPGTVRAGTDGAAGTIEYCSGSNCTEMGRATLNIDTYRVDADEVVGVYQLNLPDNESLPENLRGAQATDDFDDDLQICSEQSAVCG